MTLVSVGLGVILLLITIGGVAFNSYIIFFSCTKTSRQNRSASQLLLLHLGFLNLFLAVLFIIAFAPSFFQASWLGNASCDYVGPFWESFHIVAVWTIMILNADKYVTIASPLHYARFVSPSKAAAALFIAWTLALFIVVPPAVIEGLSFNVRNVSGCCAVDLFASSFVIGNVYAAIATSLGFVLPILVVALANGRILVIASHHRHRIVAALWNVTISAQATVTQQKSHFYLTNYRGKSAAMTILHHVGSLFLMYLPTVACRIYEAVTRLRVNHSLEMGAFVLLVVSPTVNGFVYGVKSKVLRKLMVHLLRKQLYRSEVSCEIQARIPSSSTSRRPSTTPSITLPLQKQLTRRMSEIFTSPCRTPSTSSINSCTDQRQFRLERQSSDISWSRIRSSGVAISKDTLTQSSYRFSGLSPTQKFFPKTKGHQLSLDLKTPSCDSTTSSETIANGEADLSSTNRQLLLGTQHRYQVDSVAAAAAAVVPPSIKDSCEMINVIIHNGGHRQSLRRALFARNKQKSLDLESEYNVNSCPPRSASHNHMQEGQVNPSTIRPLSLSSSGALSPAKKSKKVSWFSGNFSSSHQSSRQLPNDSEESVPETLVNATKFRRKDYAKRNGFKNSYSKSFSFDKNTKEETLEETAGVKLLDVCRTNINVFNNPLQNGVVPDKCIINHQIETTQ